MAAERKSHYSSGVQFWNKSCPGLILEKAVEGGDRVAMIDAATGDAVTYRQLRMSVTRLAASLRMRGVRHGDVVCVTSTNRPQMVVVMLGVMQAGGVVTGINPAFTTEEMRVQLHDCACVCLVTTPDMLEKVEEVKAKCPRIKEVFTIGEAQGYTSCEELIAGGNPEDSGAEIYPDDVAMLPYSSGTTGKPKGVMLTHSNLTTITQILNHPEVELVGRKLRLLGVFPLYHVGGAMLTMLAALYALSTVVYMPVYSFSAFLQNLQRYKIQLVVVPPPILLLLDKSPDVSQCAIDHLQTVLVGAAPVSQQVAQSVAARLSVTVRQVYGMTESSCLSHVTPRGLSDLYTSGLILPNMECKIVKPLDGSTLGYMEDGEVCIRSPGVMKGYLNKPDATANTVTPDGWLHTGDIGHMSSDGLLYVVDRLKELIKYKGYQVAPAELESVLLSHPAVADAAVVGIPDEAAGEVPRGYVVLRPGHSAALTEIEDYVKDRVAPYKRLRGRLCHVDIIPKTATGKILRHVLRDRAMSDIKVNSKI